MYKCVQIFSSAYGLALLCLLIYSTLVITGAAYFLYVGLRIGDSQGVPGVVVLISMEILKFLIIVEPCHRATMESKETKRILTEINRQTDEPMLVKEITQFWKQLLLTTKVEFSAMGIVNIDRRLITSIINVMSTFLVILIQFHNLQ
ncbi:gustatory receptor for sugar taste 43a-like [Eurosta solidaginis]|uniref:gustatory receptor for sugar taste 43a-like n=1 Tax=Eurosta solidaginis TaxID=178769 RepID=UPI0035317CF3